MKFAAWEAGEHFSSIPIACRYCILQASLQPSLGRTLDVQLHFSGVSSSGCYRMALAANRVVILFLLIAVTSVFAYVPAQPTNSSAVAIAGGLNVTDISKLYLKWYSNGFVCGIPVRRHTNAHYPLCHFQRGSEKHIIPAGRT
jgi:hypothetical protein